MVVVKEGVGVYCVCAHVQVNWLLLALVQDNPKSKHVEQLKERCEKAALEGKWVRDAQVT